MRNVLRAAACIVLLPLAATVGCTPGTGVAEERVDKFIEAVQEEDVDRLYCLLAGAAAGEGSGGNREERRSDFEGWVRSRFAAYLEGRERGRVDLDGSGIALVKLLALGKGTFYEYRAVRAPDDPVREVAMEVRTGYPYIDLSPFESGTTLYFCGSPIGEVERLRVPRGRRTVTLQVLDSVRLVWTLREEPSTAACPGGLKIVSVAPVAGSEVTTSVTWEF